MCDRGTIRYGDLSAFSYLSIFGMDLTAIINESFRILVIRTRGDEHRNCSDDSRTVKSRPLNHLIQHFHPWYKTLLVPVFVFALLCFFCGPEIDWAQNACTTYDIIFSHSGSDTDHQFASSPTSNNLETRWNCCDVVVLSETSVLRLPRNIQHEPYFGQCGLRISQMIMSIPSHSFFDFDGVRRHFLHGILPVNLAL